MTTLTLWLSKLYHRQNGRLNTVDTTRCPTSLIPSGSFPKWCWAKIWAMTLSKFLTTRQVMYNKQRDASSRYIQLHFTLTHLILKSGRWINCNESTHFTTFFRPLRKSRRNKVCSTITPRTKNSWRIAGKLCAVPLDTTSWGSTRWTYSALLLTWWSRPRTMETSTGLIWVPFLEELKLPYL